MFTLKALYSDSVEFSVMLLQEVLMEIFYRIQLDLLFFPFLSKKRCVNLFPGDFADSCCKILGNGLVKR